MLFSKNYFKISIFIESPYKFGEMSGECNYIIFKCNKNNKIGLDPEELLEKGRKILENFGEARL